MVNFLYEEETDRTIEWIMAHRAAIKTVARFLGVPWADFAVSFRVRIWRRNLNTIR
jgi:hypothetical protein